MNLIIFPTINASLNALAGVFLLLGWIAIKNKNQPLHKIMMLYAFSSSILFLCSYVTYHALKHGVVTRYPHEGILKTIYLLILGTHTPLAVIIVPLSIMAIRYALKGNFVKHIKITRILFPVWSYVSVTGVLIYLMLYIWV